MCSHGVSDLSADISKTNIPKSNPTRIGTRVTHFLGWAVTFCATPPPLPGMDDAGNRWMGVPHLRKSAGSHGVSDLSGDISKSKHPKIEPHPDWNPGHSFPGLGCNILRHPTSLPGMEDAGNRWKGVPHLRQSACVRRRE